MSKESQKPIADAFKPITDLVVKIEDAPKNFVGVLESAPKNIVSGINSVNKDLDEVVGASKDLADPKRFGDIATNLGQIPNNIDSEAVKNLAAKFISGVLNNVSSTTERVLMSTPFTAIPLATTISLAKTAENIGKTAEGMTKIANDAVEKTAEKISRSTSLPNTQVKVSANILPPSAPPSKIQLKKGGGAKTRRHLKKIISNRQLIQTRTNKMISEFLGRATTQNKKQISKKSKRRRRR